MTVQAEHRNPQSATSGWMRQRSAAIYARSPISSHGHSPLGDQITSCSAEALERSLTVTGIYTDLGLRGLTLAGNAGLYALMEAARRGEFACVIVFDTVAISQSLAEAAMVHEALGQFGVALISVVDGLLGPERHHELLMRHLIATQTHKPFWLRRLRCASAAKQGEAHG